MKRLNAMYIVIAAVLFVLSIALTKLPAYNTTGSEEINASSEYITNIADIGLSELESDEESGNISGDDIKQESSTDDNNSETETMETETETESQLTEEEESIRDYLENTDFSEIIDFDAQKPFEIKVNSVHNLYNILEIRIIYILIRRK